MDSIHVSNQDNNNNDTEKNSSNNNNKYEKNNILKMTSDRKEPKLDQEIVLSLQKLFSDSSLLGALISDEKGLCLSARGKLNPLCSGFVASLVSNARVLGSISSNEANRSEEPIICIETNSSNIFIRGDEKMSFAFYKSP